VEELSVGDITAITLAMAGEARPVTKCRSRNNWINKFFPDHTYSKDCWRQFKTDKSGRAIINLYGDQKRHEMGEGLAEGIDEFMKGPSVWRTKELWGMASTAPWIHDGIATTITEAIHWHGGEGEESRDNYFYLTDDEKDNILDFLRNLVIYDFERDIIQNSDNYEI